MKPETDSSHLAAPSSSRTSGEAAPNARLHVLQHSIGADQHGRIVRGGGRNHFVTGEDSNDHPHCMALVEAGLMTRRAGSAISGGDDIFHVTEAGKRYVTEHSPKPPKRSASQRRYDDFLAEDSGLKFGEWLKARSASGSPARPGRDQMNEGNPHE